MSINNVKNPVLSDKDLGLIREYAGRYKEGGFFGGRKVEHARFPQPIQNNYSFPFFWGNRLFGDDYSIYDNKGRSASGSGHTSTSKRCIAREDDKTSYGLMFAIAALGASVIYFVSCLPKLYNFGKEYYYTRKIKQLANRTSTNPHEIEVINNLKELVKADKSAQFLRNQNVKALTAFGIISASGTYIAATIGNISNSLDGFVRSTLPNFMQPSNSLLRKTAVALSNNNLKTFAAAVAVGSLGLLVLNKTYNLYKDFFYDVENPKMYLHRKAVKIERSLNVLECGPVNSTFKNFFLLGSEVLKPKLA